MTSTNQAAWLDAVGQPLRVGSADILKAREGEIVVRNRAIAVNPVSCKAQDTGVTVQRWPVLLEYDISGEVYEVGAGVDKFRKGDRVVACVEGPMNPDSRHGAFQLFSVAKTVTVAKIPDNVAFTEACVLPIAFNTAVVSLCAPLGKGFGLPVPSLHPAPSGKTIIVWGASSSVGVLTLQLARAAGIMAIGVASVHNFDLCTSCGAVEMLDYHESSIVQDVVRTVQAVGGSFVGILDCVSIPEQSLKFCIPVLEHLGGGELGILSPQVQPEVSNKITVTHIFGMNEITHAFWRYYITPALEQGKLKCLPKALVVGKGLESLQKALDVLRKGVSAKKVIVEL
ncbi:hypothetical protein LTR37_014109 [Vermiconidia calcicola]|uniref:Uncharacterized protein n=1 Tax=Vermiconidia calcicola TaxID=1690605 RepID=A0ACC3MUN0_9PEZI|nr:hypothetical protein LTR37_014109 [Vermiconidia calcicola]